MFPALLPPTHTQMKWCAEICLQSALSPPSWWNTSRCKMTLQRNLSMLRACLGMGHRPCRGQILCTGYWCHFFRAGILWWSLMHRAEQVETCTVDICYTSVAERQRPSFFCSCQLGFSMSNIFPKTNGLLSHIIRHAFLSIYLPTLCIRQMNI